MTSSMRMAARYSDEIEKGVESLINCLICTEPYKDPRVLPCQHTFCRDCLQRYHDNFNTQRIIKVSNFPCPSCRKTVYLPQGELTNLPKDFKVGQISDFFDKINIISKTSRGTVLCDICRHADKKIEAASFCVQCSKYLCTTCTIQHGDSILFKGHSTMTLDTPDVSVLECEEHNEEIKYYCRPCGAALCTVCALSKHSKHDTAELATAMEQQRNTIQQHVDTLHTYITDYESKAEGLVTLQKEKKTSVTATKDQVRQHVKTLVTRLQDEEKKMLSELDTMLCQTTDQIKAEETGIQTSVNAIQSLCDMAEKLIQQDQSLQLLATSASMQTRLKKMIATPCPPIAAHLKQEINFNANTDIKIGSLDLSEPAEDTMNDTSSSSGKPGMHMSGIRLTIQTPKPSGLTRSMSTNSPELRRRGRERMTSCPPVEIRSSTGACSEGAGGSSVCREGIKLLWKTEDNAETRDVAFFPDGSLVTTEYKLGTNKLQVYDAKGNLTRCLGSGSASSQLVKPWGLAINTQAGMIAVTDHGDSSIKFLNTDLNVSQTWRRLFEKPCGIAVMRSSEYVITDIGDRYLQKISVYLPNGIRIRDFGSKGTEEGQFLQPNYIAVDHHDRIVVSDSKLNCVKVLDRMGKQLFKIDSDDATNPMMPTGLAVDSQNHIIVADQSTKAVNMYSSDGKFIQKIIDVDSAPWGIGIHDTGMLGITTDPSLNIMQVPCFKQQ